MRTAFWSLLVVVVLAAAPRTARADAKAEARALVQEGAHLYEKGDLAGALGRFDQAYGKFPTAIIQFNRAQALRALGRPVEAIDAVERFLKEAIDAPVDRLREAQQLLQELQREVGSLVVLSNVDGAEVILDGTQVGTTPLAGAIAVKPGAHKVVVQKSGLVAFRRAVDIAPAGRLNVNARLVADEPRVIAIETPPAKAVPPAPPTEGTLTTTAPARDTGSLQKTFGFVTIAAGIAGLAVGGVYGWLTFSRNNQAEQICPGETMCPANTRPADITRHEQLVADAEKYQTRSVIGFVAGGAAFVAGGVLLLTAPSPVNGRPTARLAPLGGAGLAGLSLQGTW